MSSTVLDHRSLYRMPWNLADNAISWLEPTAVCNLACDGCYRENEKNSHKSLQELKHELDVFISKRNSDCISIAGGDPLLHPEIIDIVKEIYSRGLKPIMNTNGVALDKKLLIELKKAGLFGFTFHVDSKQGRTGKWKAKNEIELNELRFEYANLLNEVGGLSCSFNSTVYEDTFQYIPEMIEWAHRNIDIVHTMVFIAFRQEVPKLQFDWFAGSNKVNWQEIKYHSEHDRKVDILSTDMLNLVQQKFPQFKPLAYLNGTEKVDTFKWLFTERVGNKKKIYGYLGPKFMELVMATHHFVRGKYLSYISPAEARMGRIAMLLLWPFDKGLRNALRNWLKDPLGWFKRSNLQTILFIQPVDFTETGNQNMCDGCPDITVWNDDIVWSCRLEELKRFGTFLHSVSKN
ncbi:MAG: radical SAM protein [Melioribacteraceae bacterium]|nr:radical SAM protein [Melioribacteraceae bacterium]